MCLRRKIAVRIRIVRKRKRIVRLCVSKVLWGLLDFRMIRRRVRRTRIEGKARALALIHASLGREVEKRSAGIEVEVARSVLLPLRSSIFQVEIGGGGRTKGLRCQAQSI